MGVATVILVGVILDCREEPVVKESGERNSVAVESRDGNEVGQELQNPHPKPHNIKKSENEGWTIL